MVDVIRNPFQKMTSSANDARYQRGIRNSSEFGDETYEPPKNDEILFEQSGLDVG